MLALSVAAALGNQLGCVATPVWKGDEGTAYGLLNRATITLLAMTDPAARVDVA